MWPQPPQPLSEPSGLMSLQLEPVPEMSTIPPGERARGLSVAKGPNRAAASHWEKYDRNQPHSGGITTQPPRTNSPLASCPGDRGRTWLPANQTSNYLGFTEYLMPEMMADPVLIVTICTINHTDIDPLLLHEGNKTLPQLFKDGRAVKPENRPVSFLRSHKLALAGLGLIM